MARLNRLRPAGLLAASIGLCAAACGTDYIDLLPLSAGASVAGQSAGRAGQTSSGQGGTEITAGAGMGGAHAGMGGRPNAGDGGIAGAFQNGGKAGAYGCTGVGCGGTNAGSAGRYDPPCSDPNSPFCTPCDTNDECPQQFNCNPYKYCRPECSMSSECPNDGICDAVTSTCVPCMSDPQCKEQGVPWRNVCEAGRCVECNERAACAQGTCHLYQCVECTNDKDCASGRCDEIRGRCLSAP